MKRKELDDILYCLGDNRRLLYYYKDRYCLDRFKQYMEKTQQKHLAISKLKQKPWQTFLTKPIMQEIIKHCGNGLLSKEALDAYYPENTLAFTLTLDRWGEGDRGYDQTSRNQQNLVLQINFDNKHNQVYQRLLKPRDADAPFKFFCHPVRSDKQNTLSWVRMDIDLNSGEVLIEEIQNDWLRRAQRCLKRLSQQQKYQQSTQPGDIIEGINGSACDFKYYVETVLRPYQKLWAEISLFAAIDFIQNELGISTVYYHTFDTGRKIKKIYNLPPKSLYTQLPKQFGFELTQQAPAFLQQDKQAARYIKAIKETQWYRLIL